MKEAKQELHLHQQRLKHASDAKSSSRASVGDTVAGDPSQTTSAVSDFTNQHIEQPLTKKAKFFDFMSTRGSPASGSAAASQHNLDERQPNLNKQFYDLHHCDADAASGLTIFNDRKLLGLRPLAQRLFSAPASSAASERVFSQAGLIMRPIRSRLSKDRLSQLVFLKCNMKL